MTLREAVAVLAAAGVASPEYDAAELLAYVTGSSRKALAVPTPEQLALFEELVARRAAREPLQHLTGLAAFRHVELAVGPGVFIPRPETEVLAGWAVERLLEMQAPVVVDLCTGSGAIARSLVDEAPHATVYAVELDDDAFAWAQVNLSGTGVVLCHGDMADAFRELDGVVDVVLGNPPYIPHQAYESVEREVRDHDPALALWSTGDDGLDAMRVLEATAARLLKPGGLVAAEHADVQDESAPEVFTATGRWADVRDHRDLAGRPRFVTARLAG